MQSRIVWVAAAGLLAGVLGGCAGQGLSSGTPTDASRAAKHAHGRLESILDAPSAFDCMADGAIGDVFEEQCEAETRNSD